MRSDPILDLPAALPEYYQWRAKNNPSTSFNEVLTKVMGKDEDNSISLEADIELDLGTINGKPLKMFIDPAGGYGWSGCPMRKMDVNGPTWEDIISIDQSHDAYTEEEHKRAGRIMGPIVTLYGITERGIWTVEDFNNEMRGGEGSRPFSIREIEEVFERLGLDPRAPFTINGRTFAFDYNLRELKELSNPEVLGMRVTEEVRLEELTEEEKARLSKKCELIDKGLTSEGNVTVEEFRKAIKAMINEGLCPRREQCSKRQGGNDVCATCEDKEELQDLDNDVYDSKEKDKLLQNLENNISDSRSRLYLSLPQILERQDLDNNLYDKQNNKRMDIYV